VVFERQFLIIIYDCLILNAVLKLFCDSLVTYYIGKTELAVVRACVVGIGRQFWFDICSSVVDLRVQQCSEVSAISEVCRSSSVTVAETDKMTCWCYWCISFVHQELMSYHVILCLCFCVFVCLCVCLCLFVSCSGYFFPLPKEGGYAFTHVCLSVLQITQKVMSGCWWNFFEGGAWSKSNTVRFL